MKRTLLLCAAFLVIICRLCAQNIYCDEINEVLKSSTAFPFGVASGDPTNNSVVLWTAINPFRIAKTLEVQIQVSEKEDFSELVYLGLQSISANTGYTVKINVRDIEAGKKFYYRFIYDGVYSDTGITKTIDDNPSDLTFAVVSCSNYEWGFFNAYASIAKIKDLDAVIHLGDYIYEYQPDQYGNKKLSRKHVPAQEIKETMDYRSRYAQYRLDPSLQELHRVVPFITVWDDHEIANDAYKEGAQNHQPEEGSWENRKKNARQVYFEWMPLQNNADYSIQRNFHFGDLADLFMLDGRLEGRTKQVASVDDPNRKDSTRTMLGLQQRDWLMREISHSSARWKLIGNQVIFSSFNLPTQLSKYGKSMDMWEGYPYERDLLLNQWHEQNKKDIIILTGDVHASFCMDLRYDINDQNTSIGAEWVTPSITSASLDEYIATWKTKIAENKLSARELNPHLKYVNFRDHGYMLVELTKDEAKATWYFEKNILKDKPAAVKNFTHVLSHSTQEY